MAKDDGIDCSKDDCMTQQNAKDECDINVIMARALKGAEIPVTGRTPFYGDFTQIPTDLRDCLNIVRKANDAFMSLDAHVRRRFENDPAQLLDFLNDPKNREEAVSLGLVEAPKEPVVEPPVEAPIASSGVKKAKAKADAD